MGQRVAADPAFSPPALLYPGVNASQKSPGRWRGDILHNAAGAQSASYPQESAHSGEISLEDRPQLFLGLCIAFHRQSSDRILVITTNVRVVILRHVVNGKDEEKNENKKQKR